MSRKLVPFDLQSKREPKQGHTIKKKKKKSHRTVEQAILEVAGEH